MFEIDLSSSPKFTVGCGSLAAWVFTGVQESAVLDAVLDMKALIEDRNFFPSVPFPTLSVGLFLVSLHLFGAGLESCLLSILVVGFLFSSVSTFISLLGLASLKTSGTCLQRTGFKFFIFFRFFASQTFF